MEDPKSAREPQPLRLYPDSIWFQPQNENAGRIMLRSSVKQGQIANRLGYLFPEMTALVRLVSSGQTQIYEIERHIYGVPSLVDRELVLRSLCASLARSLTAAASFGRAGASFSGKERGKVSKVKYVSKFMAWVDLSIIFISFFYQSISLSIHLSMQLSIHLSIYLSIYIYI